MPKSRAEQLYYTALSAVDIDELDNDQHNLFKGIATMIAEATKPKVTKVKEQPKLAINPKDFYEYIRDHCPTVLCVPYNKRWFGMLGKSLQAIDGLDDYDAVRVGSWINAGGLKGWPVQPTFDHVIKHLPAFVMKARASEGTSTVSTAEDMFD